VIRAHVFSATTPSGGRASCTPCGSPCCAMVGRSDDGATHGSTRTGATRTPGRTYPWGGRWPQRACRTTAEGTGVLAHSRHGLACHPVRLLHAAVGMHAITATPANDPTCIESVHGSKPHGYWRRGLSTRAFGLTIRPYLPSTCQSLGDERSRAANRLPALAIEAAAPRASGNVVRDRRRDTPGTPRRATQDSPTRHAGSRRSVSLSLALSLTVRPR
jgi:hypothetical protein